MTALTPVIFGLEQFSGGLNSVISDSLGRVQVLSRTSISQWRTDTIRTIIAHDEDHNNEYVDAIKAWLSACTKKDFENFSTLELVSASLELYLAVRSENYLAAKRELAYLQKESVIREFPGLKHQHHQHNLLEDLTTTVEDLDQDDLGLTANDTEDDGDEDDGGEDDGGEDDAKPLLFAGEDQNQLNSPPRKKRKTAGATVLNEDQDILNVTARSKSKWNKYLKANPDVWLQKCIEWSQELQAAYQDCMISDLPAGTSASHYTKVVNTLREIRQVQAGVFRDKNWIAAVKSSELAQNIYSWSHPHGLFLWQASFAKLLLRKHRINVTLLLVLESWIPDGAKSSWVLLPQIPQFSLTAPFAPTKLARHIFTSLKKHPDIVPHEAYPSAIFFLLNFENFYEAGLAWLGPAFVAKGINAKFLNSRESALEAYSVFMTYLHSFKGNELEQVESPALQAIFRRTIQFRNLIPQAKEKFFANKASQSSPCSKCKNKPADKQCVQKILVDVKKMDESVIGCGVSFAPRERVSAVPIRNSKNGKFEPRPVLHPLHDLHLRAIKCSPEVLQDCGCMTFYFCDKKNPEITLDFWTFGAFSENVLAILISHHQALQNVKSVKRGKQFDTYTQGQMFPKGSRAPSGGSPGDAYAMYTGMDAVDETSINALFDDAEDSMILLQASRVIHSSLFHKLQFENIGSDKLGTTGVTAYLCRNYASPLHCDNDVCPGLCAQYELQAKKQGDEYGFVYGDYGIYVVSQGNCLWSFDGSATHGTILPSTDPLGPEDITIAQGGQPDDEGDRPPPRVSNGIHVTKTKRNTVAAQKYRHIEQSRKNIGEYWDVSD